MIVQKKIHPLDDLWAVQDIHVAVVPGADG